MMRCIFLAAFLALAAGTAGAVEAGGAAGSDGGASGDLDELMHSFAQRRHGEVSFVEQHFMALLARPVESWGELIYDAPARLEKRTQGPKQETMILEGDALTIRRGRRVHVLDLQAYPEILLAVESMRATLAGDMGALARFFVVDFDGDLARWTMTLSPRDHDAAKIVAHVRIEGVGDRLLRVEIRNVDGDRSLLTLRDHPAP